jgi:hypothetical protein
MRVVISACTHKAFLYGLMPLAHLKLRPIHAVNDNNALFSPPRSFVASHTKKAAYGRAGVIVAMLVLVVGIISRPLFQGLAGPVTTASDERSKVIRGSPTAPGLLPPRQKG